MVVSTVGPYRRQGLALVEACAAAGTDYADLTGEVLFIRDSIDRCHQTAAGTGARIVHCCGFDSIPSDLGVLLLHQAARADGAGDLQDTTLVVTALKGGVSGGTLASMMGQLDEVRAAPGLGQVVDDPYALSPDRAAEPDLGDERDLSRLQLRPRAADVAGPLRHGQHQHPGGAPQQCPAGLGLRPPVPLPGGHRVRLRPGRAAAGRRRQRGVPVPGGGAGVRTVAGPARPAAAVPPARDPARRPAATATSASRSTPAPRPGTRYVAEVEAQGDPGYAATSVMLSQSALCLALDRDRLPGLAGVLTPASAMGAALISRLRAAGLTLTARPA